MKFKNILLAFIPCILASACKKEDVLLYDGEESGIYFQTGGIISSGSSEERYYDSTVFSFTTAPSTRMDTILDRRARVRTMGKVRDYPRQVRFSVDRANSTAVEGKHFEIDVNAVVIPAGASEAYVPVKFKRTADMLDSTFILMLKLEDNEHFKVYMETQRNSSSYSRNGAHMRADKFKFIVGEIYTIPGGHNYWRLVYKRYWGEWTVTKFKYINDVLGWTAEDWANSSSGSSPVQLGVMDYAAMKVRNALQALADAGTPKLDEDGSKMQLGANYQVKY